MVRGGAAVILALTLLAMSATVSSVEAQTGYAFRPQPEGESPQDILYSIDMQTGQAVKIGPAGGFMGVESFSFDLGCRNLYGVDDVTDKLVTCSIATGACTPVGPLGV